MFWHDFVEGLLFPASMPTLWQPHQRGLVSVKAEFLPCEGMWLKKGAHTTPKARVLFLGSMTHGMYHHLKKIECLTQAGFEVLLWTPSCAKPGQLMSLQGFGEDAGRVLNSVLSSATMPLYLYGEGVGAYAWMQALMQDATRAARVSGFVSVGLWTSIAAWAKSRYGWMVGRLVEKGFPPYASPEKVLPRLACPLFLVTTQDDGATPGRWVEVGIDSACIQSVAARTEDAFLTRPEVIESVLNDWLTRSSVTSP